MSTRLPLALLFSSLVAGCGDDKQDDSATDTDCNHSCCGFEGGTYEYEQTFTVDAATYEAALNDADALTPEGCEQLCLDYNSVPESFVGAEECVDHGADEAGDHELYCRWTEEAYCEGRAHAGLARAVSGEGPDAVAAWLARAARAEASSACAFSKLRHELLQHDAPDALLARCQAAARDEIAHARRMRGLAKARGARVMPVAEVPFPPRSLEDIATENAVEGCVGETWSALQAVHQARSAADPQLRVAMARIAEDETRHAELARDLHAWFLTRLSPEAAARVEAARVAAWTRLQDAAAQKPDAPPALGLPSPDDAVRMMRGLAASWAA